MDEHEQKIIQERKSLWARIYHVSSIDGRTPKQLMDILIKKVNKNGNVWVFNDMDLDQLAEAYNLTNDMLSINHGVKKL